MRDFLDRHRSPPRPGFPFRIDESSLQAVGLELLITYAFGGRGIALPIGGMTQGVSLFRADATLGAGTDFDTTNNHTFPYADAPFITAQGLTVLWTGIIDSAASIRNFTGKHGGVGVSATPFEFRTGGIDVGSLCLQRANTGEKIWSASGLVTQGALITYGFRCTDNLVQTACDFFVNGAKTAGVDNGGAGTGAVTGSGADIRIGVRTDGAAPMDGYCYEVRYYRQAISDDAIAAVSDPNTRSDIYWRPSKAFVFMGGGGGAGKGPGSKGKKGGGGGLNILYPGGAYEFNIGNPGLDIGST